MERILRRIFEKKDTNIMKKEVNKLLTKLDKENYLKFKKYSLNTKKKQFKKIFFNIVYTGSDD